MTKTTVVHVKDTYDVYIGRAVPRMKMKASPWANPFKIGADGTREEVIGKYRTYIMGRPDLLARLAELEGKRLGCWCRPEACHGDVLLELIEQLDEDHSAPPGDVNTNDEFCSVCGLSMSGSEFYDDTCNACAKEQGMMDGEK